MSTFLPRSPYTDEEILSLYPKGLKLQLVQVLLRHGERTPVSARFQNAGLAPYWPYCKAATQMASGRMPEPDGSSVNQLQWCRKLETFGENDAAVLASGPCGETNALCQPGEMTDKGHETTLALGQRLRRLYVDQLDFMPKVIEDADTIYLRATAIPRALLSLQQCFMGMYPASARTASFTSPTIISRTAADETLYPNPPNCQRLSQLSKAFAQRTADRWNDAKEMDYINSLISEWMAESEKRVAVDSHPRLSGIMDTINSTLAHGPATRLPDNFYDPRGRDIMDKITMEEWFSGFKESQEYRKLGIGSLIGDIVARMVNNAESNMNGGRPKVEHELNVLGTKKGREDDIKFAMSGCHDSTLAAMLSSLGAFEGEKWPPYTSHIAIELFSHTRGSDESNESKIAHEKLLVGGTKDLQSPMPGSSSPHKSSTASKNIGRRNMNVLTPAEKRNLDGFYVRIRYNDRPIVVPGCRQQGKHLRGDVTFCTLEAFKSIADKFTPRNWKEACLSNMDKSPFPKQIEPAGY